MKGIIHSGSRSRASQVIILAAALASHTISWADLHINSSSQLQQIDGAWTESGFVRFSGSRVSGYAGEVSSYGLRFANGIGSDMGNDVTVQDGNSCPIVGVVGSGTVLRYTGHWAGDGFNAFNHLYLTQGGRFVLSGGAQLDFVNDSYFTRQLWVLGDGTGILETDSVFAADQTMGGTVPSGIGSYRFSNAIYVSRHTQGLPQHVRAGCFDRNPCINGHFVFENQPGSRWVVADRAQHYDGGIWGFVDFTVEAQADVRHSGTLTRWSDYTLAGAFQSLNADVVITKTGTGALTLAGEQAYSNGTRMAIQQGVVVFDTDAAGGWFRPGTTQGGQELIVDVQSGGEARFQAAPVRVKRLQQVAGGRTRVHGTARLDALDASLAGILELDITGMGALTIGQELQVFQWGTISGLFDSLELPAEYGWDASRLYNEGKLIVADASTPPPPPPPPPPPEEQNRLYRAFAFGKTNFTRPVPSSPDRNYVKVVQSGANFTYSGAVGHGYTNTSGLDGSPNDRGKLSGPDEIYDQFIGAKSGGSITFRIDLPNGDYRFVAAGGDAQYSGHVNTLRVRDGSSGSIATLVESLNLPANHFYTIGFDTLSPPAGDGAGTQPNLLARSESPTLSVTQGYLELIQSTPGTGGDLCLFEVWQVDATPPEPLPVIAFSLAESSVDEGSGSVALAVTLSEASLQTVTISYAVTGGSASQASDYSLTGSILSFAPGETAKEIPVSILDDNLTESQETLVLELHSPVNAQPGAQFSHTLTILDNDAPASLAYITQPTTVEVGQILTPVEVEVRNAAGQRIANSGNSITLSLSTNPGGASLGGTKTLAASAGVASFINLSLDYPGQGYVLAAAATGLAGAFSMAFDVSAPPPPPPPPPPSADPALQKAFAFGADTWTRAVPGVPGASYRKVTQGGANFSYGSAQGHGYTATADIDGTPNNRGKLSGNDEIYDQFIGVKSGGTIVFRVDVPNGDYAFVAAGGDASYNDHVNTLKIRDGASGDMVTLVENLPLAANIFYSVGFDTYGPPPGDGIGTQPGFLSRTESPILTVTQGYLEVHQSSSGNGGDLCLLEIWSLPTAAPPPQISLTRPLDGSRFASLADLMLTADASQEGGSISSVRFFVDGVLQRDDLSAPYSWHWPSAATGDYQLIAQAVGDDLQTATATAAIHVGTQPLRILPMGGSVTAGIQSTDGSGYRGTLAAILTAAGLSHDFVGSLVSGPTGGDNNHEGHIGYTLSQLSQNANLWLMTNPADVLLLLGGFADLAAGSTLQQRWGEMATLLDTIAFVRPDLRLVVSTLPPVTDATLNPAQVADYNRGLAQLVQEKAALGRHITLVDPYAAMDPALHVGVDGRHPNDAGYEIMAHVWQEALAEIFAGNTPPSAVMTSPQHGTHITEGDCVLLGASAADPDGSVAEVRFYDNGDLLATAATSPYSHHACVLMVGDHLLEAEVLDAEGGVSYSQPVLLTVEEVAIGNTAPQVDVGPDRQVNSSQVLSLAATATDDGLPSGTLTHTWSTQSGPATATFTAPGSLVTGVSFPIEGVYVLRLTSSDGELSGYDELQVTRVDLVPTASFTITPTSGASPLTVAFDASASSDIDGTIVGYAWEFGDGGTGSGNTTGYTYNAPGSYTAVLTVTDNDGKTGQSSRMILVTESGTVTGTLIHEDFQNISEWTDLSTLITWGGKPLGSTGFVLGANNGLQSLSLSADAMARSGYSGSADLKTFTALDFKFPSAVDHRTQVLTITFRARWNELNSPESNRLMVVLMDDYPAGGVRGEDLSNLTGDPYGTPALHLRIRPNLGGSHKSFLHYGGGNWGEYEVYNSQWWLPGFIQNALGSSHPSPGQGDEYPNGSWKATTRAIGGTNWATYVYKILPNRQEVYENGELVGAMDLPETLSTAPQYEYYEQFRALRLYFRASKQGYVADFKVEVQDY